MSTKPVRIPKYRHHKPSGRGVVTIGGKDFYLPGKFDSPESREGYARMIGELRVGAAGGQRTTTLLVWELCVRYDDFAAEYYQTPEVGGRPGPISKEVHETKAALKTVRELYGLTSVSEFGPLALKAVRQAFIDQGLSRSTVNKRAGRIKRMFKWGTENELVSGDVFHALQAVSGLKRGRTAAKETEPVEPVADAIVDATIPHLPAMVADMVRVQRLTGMRSGELCMMQVNSIDRSGKVWIYTPPHHKTAYLGHARIVAIGPRAQQIIIGYIGDRMAGYVFRPSESVKASFAERHSERKTPLKWGNRPGKSRAANPKRPPRDHYDRDSYRKAINRACLAAFPVPAGLDEEQSARWNQDHHWHPHQLRHSLGTEIRKQFGLDQASAVLGHRNVKMTEHYAKIDAEKSIAVIGMVG